MSEEFAPIDLPLLTLGGDPAGSCGPGCGCGGGDGAEPAVLDPQIAGLLDVAGLDPEQVAELAAVALEEDLGETGVDVTTVATVREEATAVADFTAREAGVVAGLPVALAVLSVVATDDLDVTFHASDGDRVAAGQVLMSVRARTRELLTAERGALNLLCHLSGIATATRAWVDAVDGTGAAIRDTRKTTPGLRALEKYAVRRGGGVNHRMSLHDAALVKDNHVVAVGGVRAAFEAVRGSYPDLPIEVEVDGIDQIEPVVLAGADLVLLDNFTVEQVAEAVALVAGRAKLEASGGLTLDAARDYAATGVDYLAVGALTHSAPVLDIGLDLHDDTAAEG